MKMYHISVKYCINYYSAFCVGIFLLICLCMIDWCAWAPLKQLLVACCESILTAGSQRMTSGWTAPLPTSTHSAGQRLLVIHWMCHKVSAHHSLCDQFFLYAAAFPKPI